MTPRSKGSGSHGGGRGQRRAISDMRHPTHGVKLFKMRVRERFLSPEERQRLHEAMEAGLKLPAGRKGHLEPRSVWALQLLLLTGLRRDEIRDLTWPMVDWQHACAWATARSRRPSDQALCPPGQ